MAQPSSKNQYSLTKKKLCNTIPFAHDVISLGHLLDQFTKHLGIPNSTL